MGEHSTSAHGTTTRYRRGCRCGACRAAKAEHNRKWRAAHREQVADYLRKWRADHCEKKAEYDHNYYVDHREEMAEANHKWRAAHHEEMAEYQRNYRVTHPEEIAAIERNRRARERGNGGTHIAADVQAQYERQKGKCFYRGERLGSDYHVDHVIPLALGGSNGPENLVIACARCNQTKYAKHPMDFAGIMF
jgi:5-methylcytosine-specific restriction endonuclease McrA